MFEKVMPARDANQYRKIQQTLNVQLQRASENLDWLYANLHPYFFITMKEESDAIVGLAEDLNTVTKQRKITLADEEKKLIVARLDIPGSLYDTLKTLKEREISYAEITHSSNPLPDSGRDLEILRFEFDRKSSGQVTGSLR